MKKIIIFLALICISFAENLERKASYLDSIGEYGESYQIWVELANNGNVKAMNNVAYIINNSLDIDYNKEQVFYWYKKAASMGDSKSVLDLAYLYMKEKNYSEAIYWYGIESKAENSYAKVQLAYIYQNGLGIEKNIKIAKELLEEATELGNIEAYYRLAYIYMYEKEFRNYEKAFLLFEIAANNDNEKAMNSLAYMYKNGLGVNMDLEEAYNWYYLAANKGIDEAKLHLADLYLKGYGSYEDFDLILEFSRELAERNNVQAFFMLGDLTNNSEEAIYWYKKAFNLGHKNLAIQIAYRYINLNEEKEAYSWFLKASEQYNADAYYNLGYLNIYGTSIKTNPIAAISYFENAANRGNVKAMNALAYLYKIGLGTDIDYDKAFYWYKKSAELGDRESMEQLAYLYKYGFGTEENKYRAKKWFKDAGF